MHTITLHIQDHALDRVMAVLDELPKQDVSMEQVNDKVHAHSMSQLSGVLSKSEKLTDADIEQGIGMGVLNSAMMASAHE